MNKLLAIVLSLACGTALAQSATQTSASGDSTTKKPASSGTTSSTHKTTTPATHSSTHTSSSKKSSRRKKSKLRGQQKIDPERARSIQEALIREHYLTGEPSGTWNERSEEAMRKFQADHGWQSKTVPDSRALIALGLGPSHDHLLNPESAMTTGPTTAHASSPAPTSQSPAPTSSTPAPVTTPNDSPSPQ